MVASFALIGVAFSTVAITLNPRAVSHRRIDVK